jgi:hypothetical protein
MVETVNLGQDGSRATITGRKRAPLRKKMNPVWWFMNSSEQTVDEAPWYRPALPYWQRWLYWSISDPLQNLRAFVLGVSDKNYSIIGRAPVMCVQRNDCPRRPASSGACCTPATPGPLGFFSYSGEQLFGILAINRAGSLGAS